jgi:fatty acid omega-hydroxylase
MLAGWDTTACALSWTFYELTKNPHVIPHLLQDVYSICYHNDDEKNDNNGDVDYSYDKISQFRLHPSVPIDIKVAVKKDVLPDGTIILAGAGVCYLPYAMGRSDSIWGGDACDDAPPVQKFHPRRFLCPLRTTTQDMDLKCVEPSSFRYAAFNAGPRLCLWKPLTLMTIKIVLARVLTRYCVEDVHGHDGECFWRTVL